MLPRTVPDGSLWKPKNKHVDIVFWVMVAGDCALKGVKPEGPSLTRSPVHVDEVDSGITDDPIEEEDSDTSNHP